MRLADAITTLSATPASLADGLERLSDEQLHFNPEGGYFSVLENICHLRDVELEGYRIRLQRLLAERHPRLPDLDGGKLARERHYNRQSLRPVLDAFIQARRANLAMLEKLTEDQLARSGYLEPVGEITLGRLLELWVEHDQGHIQELKKLRAAFHGSGMAAE